MTRFISKHSTQRLAAAAMICSCLCVASPSAHAQTPGGAAAPSKPPEKFRDFGETIKGTEKMDGLYTLYRTNDTLYAELKPGQLDQAVIAPMAIARGMESAGQPLNFGDEWILVFHREGDKIQVIRRNIHYKAPERTPLEKAVKQNYSDSILMALPIVSINPATQGALIDFSQIFLSNFAELPLGGMDRNRSSWHKIKTFPNNLELEVEATFTGQFGRSSGADSVVDPRGVTLVIHYSLAKLPESGYKPRVADQRVGYFLNATKDFGSTDPDTQFVRQVNRWRLEKADPKAKLSAPKKQIVWWVEDNVPHEYRPAVEEGILEWNKAFEKIGFKNAIGVRWQNERDEFDPEDINYCTFRWITTSSTYAMSALRSNPLTGEMIDGDVIFDASWIRYWKNEYAYLIGSTPTAAGENLESPIAVAEIVSPMMAAKHGYGLPMPIPGSTTDYLNPSANNTGGYRLVPAESSPLQMRLSQRFSPGRFAGCQYSSGKQAGFRLAAIALAAAGKTDADGKLPEEFLGQVIKEVVMHEVGHSLGLRHNFVASGMLSMDEINDTSITHVKGMGGSVMDYNPVNISPKGKKQGDYASTTIGPYDYWAIEYAYKQIDGDETEELKKIASRSPEHDLAFATDEDAALNDDPYVNRYDLTSDPLRYGQERMALAADLMKNLDEKVVKDGESWARLRIAFSTLLGQFGDAAYLASSFVGGQSVNRDFKGAKSRDPINPIPGEKQREALRTVRESILSDKAFVFSPTLLRRLKSETWYHWGSDGFYAGAADYPVYPRILAIQRIVLDQCLSSTTLTRIQTQELQSDKDAKPLKMTEIFRTLTDGIWTEFPQDGKGLRAESSLIRRNLQREYLRRLCAMVIGSQRNSYMDGYSYAYFVSGSNVPADAKSMARLHLNEIAKRIEGALDQKDVTLEETTKAHLQECGQRISKVLASSYTSNEF